jgi:hypothetical protein
LRQHKARLRKPGFLFAGNFVVDGCGARIHGFDPIRHGITQRAIALLFAGRGA